MDVTFEFAAAMQAAGITPPRQIIADDRIHRFYIDGDRRGTKNGFYVLHTDGLPAGAFGSWKGTKFKWRADPKNLPANFDLAAHRAQCDQARRARIREEHQRHERARREVSARWEAACPATPSHPYLRRKHLPPFDLRQDGSRLLVPLRDRYGELWNLQSIGGDGQKRFHIDARTRGLFCRVGDFTPTPPTIAIAEGWATAAAVHQLTGLPCIAAMSAHRLGQIAILARQTWRSAEIVLFCDDDQTGREHARAAAEAIGGARIRRPRTKDGDFADDFLVQKLAKEVKE